jgi:type III secretion protein Q
LRCVGTFHFNARERPTNLAHDTVRELGESMLLPRIDPPALGALNRLYDERAAPLSLAVRGEMHRLDWVYDDTALPLHDAYRFRLGACTGQLCLDAPTQVALFGERRFERLPPELRLILLADASHDAIDALMRATRTGFEWLPEDEPPLPAAADARPAAFFRTTAESGSASDGGRGWVRFDDASAWAGLVPPLDPRRAASTDALARLRFPLRWCIGTTRIRLREVRGIGAGDIVSVEAWAAAGAAIVVNAEVGGAHGQRMVALAEGSRITIQQSREHIMNRNPEPAQPASETQEAANAPIDRLDAMEVTLRFEVGDLQVSLGELRNLRAGHVFDLGQPLNRSEVRILAHGNLLGKGHLVAVGDRLGVRVSEFAPHEI